MSINTGEKLGYFDYNDTLFWVEFYRFDGSVFEYRWGIKASDGRVIATGENLRSAADGKQPPLADMLATFLTFLSAWIEAVKHDIEADGDVDSNVDLFDRSDEGLVGLAYAYNADELATFADIITKGNPFD